MPDKNLALKKLYNCCFVFVEVSYCHCIAIKMQNKCKHVMFIKPLKKMFWQRYGFNFQSIEMGKEQEEELETKFSVYSFVPNYWNI